MPAKAVDVRVQRVPVKRRKISNTIRDRIVLDHLPLVKAIAVRVHENLPVHVDLDDLIHAGVLGLFDAACKFNPDKQVVFHSYAKYRIKGAILDSLRQLDWASRDLRKRQKMVEAITRELSDKLKRAPAEAEIAEKLGIGLDRWRRMVVELRTVGLMSASQLSLPDRDTDQHARVSSLAGQPAGQDVRARATARGTGGSGENTARPLSEGRAAVLLQRTDHEGNRRDSGHQREPRFADSQDRAGENGGRAALGWDPLDPCAGVGVRGGYCLTSVRINVLR